MGAVNALFEILMPPALPYHTRFFESIKTENPLRLSSLTLLYIFTGSHGLELVTKQSCQK